MPKSLPIALSLLAMAAVSPAQEHQRVARLHEALADPSCPAVYVIGHRGAHRRAPENSLAAIRDAIELGVHMVEIDVARSKDGAYVLMHDKTVDRTTDGSGKVRDLSLAQLRELRLMHGHRPHPERVPTLDEAIEVARGRILLQVDPKDVDFQTLVALGRKTQALDHFVLKQRWSKLDEELRRWLAAQGDVFFMPITSSLAESNAALDVHVWPALELIFDSKTHAHFQPEVLAGLRARGALRWMNCLYQGRWSGGVGDFQAVPAQGQVFGDLIARGFDMIQSDSPGLVAAYVRERGLDPLQLVATSEQRKRLRRLRADLKAGQMSAPLVIAHRGYHAAQPMNTLPALHAAVDLGVHGVMVDLHSTRDGRVLATHSDELRRSSWSKSKLSEISYAEARRIAVKHGLGTTRQRMPNLEELLWAVRDKCVLHVRPDAEQLVRLLEAAARTLTLDHLLLDPGTLDESQLTEAHRQMLGRTLRVVIDSPGFLDARGRWDRELNRRGPGVREELAKRGARFVLTDLPERWLRR